MSEFPQSLINLRSALETARKNWSEHNRLKQGDGAPVAGLVAWDIEDRKLERATMDARFAYDAALKEFLAQDQPL